MRDPRRSRITVACETCDLTLVLPAREIAADLEMDAFTQAHATHHLTMWLDWDESEATA